MAHATPPNDLQPHSVPLLRALAARGDLVGQNDLVGAAYHLVWPLVWTRHTRLLERRKGHLGCSVSVQRLDPPCLNGFHDDVESVLDYLFTHGKRPILNLEGWIVSRIGMATVDGHRKRRGRVGALQRARVPMWLAAALHDDPWLIQLAGKVIEWVGLPACAGTGTWPVDAWADARPAGHRTTSVASDVRAVLEAMSTTNPRWYATYIEQPLGRKDVPVADSPGQEHGGPGRPLALTNRDEQDDADLAQLAALAVQAIDDGLAAGEPADDVVRRVIRTLFLGPLAACHDLDRLPHSRTAARDERLSAALADTATVVDAVLAILDRSPAGAAGHATP